MLHNHFINRTVRMGGCVVALLMCASPAMSETSLSKVKRDGQECAAARKSALEREQAGHLVEANQFFLKCASATCGALSEQCTIRNSQLSLTLPSVVLSVSDAHGEPLVDVQVKMDGQLLTSHLDGLSLPVDPGTHEFSFSADAGVFDSQTLTIAKGERNHSILVSQKSANKIAVSAPVASTQASPPPRFRRHQSPPRPQLRPARLSPAVPAHSPAPVVQAPQKAASPTVAANKSVVAAPVAAAAPAHSPAPTVQAPHKAASPTVAANKPVVAAPVAAAAPAHRPRRPSRPQSPPRPGRGEQASWQRRPPTRPRRPSSNRKAACHGSAKSCVERRSPPPRQPLARADRSGAAQGRLAHGCGQQACRGSAGRRRRARPLARAGRPATAKARLAPGRGEQACRGSAGRRRRARPLARADRPATAKPASPPVAASKPVVTAPVAAAAPAHSPAPAVQQPQSPPRPRSRRASLSWQRRSPPPRRPLPAPAVQQPQSPPRPGRGEQACRGSAGRRRRPPTRPR